MGYYIQTPENKNKAGQIVKLYNGEELSEMPEKYEDIPEGKALIVVVSNVSFDAALFCYSAQEFGYVKDNPDARPKRYVLIDRKKAEELTGYKGDHEDEYR